MKAWVSGNSFDYTHQMVHVILREFSNFTHSKLSIAVVFILLPTVQIGGIWRDMLKNMHCIVEKETRLWLKLH